MQGMPWNFSSWNDVGQAINDCFVLHDGVPLHVRYIDTDDGVVFATSLVDLPNTRDVVIHWDWDDQQAWGIKLPENGNYNIFDGHGWMRLVTSPERQWRKAFRQGTAIHVEWPDNLSHGSFITSRALLYNKDFPAASEVMNNIAEGLITSAALSRTVGVHTVRGVTALSYNGKYIGRVDGMVLRIDPRLSMLTEELQELGFTVVIGG